MMNRRFHCLSGHHFFGLTPSDKEIFLEPTFNLMYYSGFSYTECINLPIWQRKWFMERINREISERKSSRQGDDETKALEGRQSMPARLQRFT